MVTILRTSRIHVYQESGRIYFDTTIGGKYAKFGVKKTLFENVDKSNLEDWLLSNIAMFQRFTKA